MEQQELGFSKILSDELKLFQKLRREGLKFKEETVYQDAHKARLVGLAFSGGGIRSATFNLGVLLALAKLGLLNRFDYLSTVSGGGYIGGWFSALLHRFAAVKEKGNKVVTQQAVEGFEPSLRMHPDPSQAGFKLPDNAGFPPVEHAAIRFLRCYSHYLIPRHGLSGDFMATVALFLRNLALLQIAIIALLATVLLAAIVVGIFSIVAPRNPPQFLSLLSTIGIPFEWEWPFTGSAIAIIVAIIFAGRLLVTVPPQGDQPKKATLKVFMGVVLPFIIAAWWLSMGMVTWPKELTLTNLGITADLSIRISSLTGGALGERAIEATLWALLGTAGYLVAWFLGYVAALLSKPKEKENKERKKTKKWTMLKLALRHFFSAAFSGAVLGLLLCSATNFVEIKGGSVDVWHGVGFGPPLILLIFCFAIAIHIGIARNGFSEQEREWWARLGGMMLMVAMLWALVFTLVIYAPPFMKWLAAGGLVAVAAWAGGSGAGAWLASGSALGTAGKKGFRNIVAIGAPWLFVIGLSIIVAYATHHALVKMFEPAGAVGGFSIKARGFTALSGDQIAFLNSLSESFVGVITTWIGTLLFFIAFSLCFDINLFSLHTLYRNRLERAYLGASRAGNRNPHPFTGFDSDDDIPFHKLGTQRPIHIINTTVNMTGGDDLAWQTRRGASFAFTPRWAGFEAKTSQGAKIGCYRPTMAYAGGLTLATLMAVSGGAASPNMGYHTSAPVAALLTALNLRLGRWCGNPIDNDMWQKESPVFSARPILSELSGSATARARWVNLTDGGHFDNLGIYELVRRRCHLIIASDASCDLGHAFVDLANAIRKCWTDFGVEIHFEEKDISALRKIKESRFCTTRHVKGRIKYPNADKEGIIIYIKAALNGTEPVDVLEYAESHKKFPHESTGDQFFDENQFDAYRHLGFDIMREAAQKHKDCLNK